MTKEILEKKLKQYHKKWCLYMIDEVSHNADVNISYGELLIKELLELFEANPEVDKKARCIEVAVRIIADLAETDYLVEDEICFLYEKYIQIIKNGYEDGEKISETLTLFLDLNIKTEKIIEDLAAIMNEHKIVKVLAGITNKALWQCEKYKKLLEKVSLYKKKCKRFDLILHFCLLTNPIYYSNIEIVGDYLKKYYNYSIVLADWIFSSELPNENYVKEGIISTHEQRIFIKIGDALNKYKTEVDSELSFDEVISKIYEISDKFQNVLNEEKMKVLYNDLFGKRNFLEVACNLPANE